MTKSKTPKLAGSGAEMKAAGTQSLPIAAASVKETSALSQQIRLFEALKRGPVTTIEARHGLNTLHPAGRVRELRKQGHAIRTRMISAMTPEGFKHHVGEYRLEQEEAEVSHAG